MSNTASSGRTGPCAGFATGRSRCATSEGEVYRIAGIAEDITERKQTREMLQTQAAILENMAEGVVVTDEQGVIVQMNPAGERIWGYARNEVLGQPASVFSALPEPEATAVMQEVLAALQATGSWRGTFQNRRKDGALIFCEAVISRLEIQGRVLMVAVEQDVTERLRAQEQLQMQARVLESMAEAVLMVDEDGTIVLTNPALDALLGYERGELAGQSMHVVSGHSPEEYRRHFKASLEQIKAQRFRRGRIYRAAKGRQLDRGRDPEQRRERRRPFLSGGRRAGHHRTEAGGSKRCGRARKRCGCSSTRCPEPALLLDRDGTILASNRALARSLGMPEGELIGQYAFGLVPPEVAEPRKAMLIRSSAPGNRRNSRTRAAGRHFLNFESPVLDTAGNVTRVAVFALDITRAQAGGIGPGQAGGALPHALRTQPGRHPAGGHQRQHPRRQPGPLSVVRIFPRGAVAAECPAVRAPGRPGRGGSAPGQPASRPKAGT